jgi:hypothetical protein
VDAFKHGYELPEFQSQLKQYPPGTVVSASFFQRVAVPGMCLGEGTIAAQWLRSRWASSARVQNGYTSCMNACRARYRDCRRLSQAPSISV